MNARGTRRPHSTRPVGRERSSSSDAGDSVGPGEGCISGCTNSLFKFVLLLLVLYVIYVFARLFGGG